MVEYVTIIIYLLNNNNYNKYINYISINKDNKELLFLYTCLKDLHESYNRDLSLDEFCFYVTSKCPDRDKAVVESMLRGLESATIDERLVTDVLTSIRNKKLAYDLALISLDVSEGRSSVDTIFSTLDQFEKSSEMSEIEFVSTDLDTLYENTLHQKGIRWRLQTLNRMLGSLRKGNFGFIFARPETGKTTFLASEVSYFATQVTSPILWFCNEESGDLVMLRCIQASLELTQPELFSNRSKYTDTFLKLGGSNILMYDSASIHKKQVEMLCKQYNPSLVLIDQLDAIKGFQAEREDLRLGTIYRWARELAKDYCPVIGITQSDASGEGKRWLNMDNVANAKTEKQAMADFIIGIGKTHDTALEYVRHLHICKNKLSGDEDTDPSMRHGKADVIIKPEVARYADIDI